MINNNKKLSLFEGKDYYSCQNDSPECTKQNRNNDQILTYLSVTLLVDYPIWYLEQISYILCLLQVFLINKELNQ